MDVSLQLSHTKSPIATQSWSLSLHTKTLMLRIVGSYLECKVCNGWDSVSMMKCKNKVCNHALNEKC